MSFKVVGGGPFADAVRIALETAASRGIDLGGVVVEVVPDPSVPTSVTEYHGGTRFVIRYNPKYANNAKLAAHEAMHVATATWLVKSGKPADLYATQLGEALAQAFAEVAARERLGLPASFLGAPHNLTKLLPTRYYTVGDVKIPVWADESRADPRQPHDLRVYQAGLLFSPYAYNVTRWDWVLGNVTKVPTDLVIQTVHDAWQRGEVEVVPGWGAVWRTPPRWTPDTPTTKTVETPTVVTRATADSGEDTSAGGGKDRSPKDQSLVAVSATITARPPDPRNAVNFPDIDSIDAKSLAEWRERFERFVAELERLGYRLRPVSGDPRYNYVLETADGRRVTELLIKAGNKWAYLAQTGHVMPTVFEDDVGVIAEYREPRFGTWTYADPIEAVKSAIKSFEWVEQKRRERETERERRSKLDELVRQLEERGYRFVNALYTLIDEDGRQYRLPAFDRYSVVLDSEGRRYKPELVEEGNEVKIVLRPLDDKPPETEAQKAMAKAAGADSFWAEKEDGVWTGVGLYKHDEKTGTFLLAIPGGGSVVGNVRSPESAIRAGDLSEGLAAYKRLTGESDEPSPRQEFVVKHETVVAKTENGGWLPGAPFVRAAQNVAEVVQKLIQTAANVLLPPFAKAESVPGGGYQPPTRPPDYMFVAPSSATDVTAKRSPADAATQTPSASGGTSGYRPIDIVIQEREWRSGRSETQFVTNVTAGKADLIGYPRDVRKLIEESKNLARGDTATVAKPPAQGETTNGGASAEVSTHQPRGRGHKVPLALPT